MKKITVVGFKDEVKLVKEVARLIGSEACLAETAKYRSGELKVMGLAKPTPLTVVAANIWEDPDVLFCVMLLAHELRYAGAKRLVLIAPWISYGRQDRATHPGEEASGIMVGKLLSAMFDKVVTLDAHSEEFIRGFKGKLVNVLPWENVQVTKKHDLIAAPDAGATSRASYAAESLGLPFIVIEKTRTGKNVKAKIPEGVELKGARILLVDDMADSGGTLKAAAVELKKARVKKISVVVTHAFDLKRLKKVLAPQTTSVIAYFDHAKGKLDEAMLRKLSEEVGVII